jgi:CHAT domain-containing protein
MNLLAFSFRDMKNNNSFYSEFKSVVIFDNKKINSKQETAPLALFNNLFLSEYYLNVNDLNNTRNYLLFAIRDLENMNTTDNLINENIKMIIYELITTDLNALKDNDLSKKVIPILEKIKSNCINCVTTINVENSLEELNNLIEKTKENQPRRLILYKSIINQNIEKNNFSVAYDVILKAKIELFDNPKELLLLNDYLEILSEQIQVINLKELFNENTNLIKLAFGENSQQELENSFNLANYYVKSGEIKNAISLFEKIYTLNKKNQNFGILPTYYLSFIISRLYFEIKEIENSVKYLNFCIQDKNRFSSNKNLTTEDSFSWSNKILDLDNFNNQISILCLGLSKEKLDIGNYYNDILINKNIILKNQAFVKKILFKNKNNQYKGNIDKILLKNIMESEISTNVLSKEYIAEINNRDWKKMKNKLNIDEICVEFINTKDSKDIGIFILKKDFENPVLFELETQNFQINNIQTNTFYNNSNLYNYLIKPIEKFLTKNNKIYFSTSGILNRINLQAIQMPDGKRFSDKYNLTQFSSTAEILNTTNFTIDKTATFSFWGDINYSADSTALVKNSTSNSFSTSNLSVAYRDSQGKEFLKLDKTRDEVLQASKLFAKENVQVMLGNFATEENLKALSLKEKSPTVLHIATHGFYFAKKEEAKDNTFDFVNFKDKIKKADNPLLRSGLILAGANRVWFGNKAYKGLEDGILTAEEVANMNLFDTKLVVLSACKSGLGDIKSNSEGVYGLQRAFKMAGVEYLLVSLWDIEDGTTQKMMQLFYGKLKEGKTIEEAYNYMVANTRSKFPNEPSKWASFVLMR